MLLKSYTEFKKNSIRITPCPDPPSPFTLRWRTLKFHTATSQNVSKVALVCSHLRIEWAPHIHLVCHDAAVCSHVIFLLLSALHWQYHNRN